jgi:hypothetical protein
MLADPGDRFGKAALVVADHQRGDGCATGAVNSRRACRGACRRRRRRRQPLPTWACGLGSPSRHRVCWVGTDLSGVTERHICDGSRARGTDRLLIKPTGGQAGAGAAGNKSDERHTLCAARSVASHPTAPAPILAAVHPEPPLRHTHRSVGLDLASEPVHKLDGHAQNLASSPD